MPKSTEAVLYAEIHAEWNDAVCVGVCVVCAYIGM